MDDFAEVERGALQPGALMVSPFVSRERFAQLVGLPVGVIVGMINKGYLPTVDVGRYSCVNVALLMRRCGEASLKLSL
ncbi:hypothetical protein [Burkholderia sp. LMG 13014]|uniref:hypothetical protein n=1 Tax=Burkholderia sp. LMG 13014 TaxID=2709306 RepID=UPI001F05D5CC|nr:hypothetical protein [Burkholderia sp. LMG 13014]